MEAKVCQRVKVEWRQGDGSMFPVIRGQSVEPNIRQRLVCSTSPNGAKNNTDRVPAALIDQ